MKTILLIKRLPTSLLVSLSRSELENTRATTALWLRYHKLLLTEASLDTCVEHLEVPLDHHKRNHLAVNLE